MAHGRERKGSGPQKATGSRGEKDCAGEQKQSRQVPLALRFELAARLTTSYKPVLVAQSVASSPLVLSYRGSRPARGVNSYFCWLSELVSTAIAVGSSAGSRKGGPAI
jgi:hypothetical protein